MAPRLATVRRPPPRREPPRQEQKAKKVEAEDDGGKPCAQIPDEKEMKYDPNLGAVVEVDEERHHNRYPSCDSTTRVAKCVYCERVKDKADMRCLGQNFHEKGSLRYVWACKGCNSSNPAWRDKISKQYKYPAWLQRMWNYDLGKDKPIKHPEEIEKAVGRQIVEKKLEEINAKIAKALDKKKGRTKKEEVLSKETLKALSKKRKQEKEENQRRFVEKYGKKKGKQAAELVDTLTTAAEKHFGVKGVKVEIKEEKRHVGKQVRSKRRGRSFTIKRAR